MRRLPVACPGWDLEPNDTSLRQPLAAAIQRFEYCFELGWKTTKDYMEANGFVFAVVMPRQVLKDAFAAKVIDDGQVWIAMLDHRNLLAYTYNPVVFEQAVEAIHQHYLPAMEQLLSFLQQEATT
jgi:nucleotidyltransferase substrate binding protein (TIGR01987 family)